MAQNPSLAPLSSLVKPPYNRLVAYPSGEPEQVESRIRQLHQLDITSLDFQGRLKTDQLSVLGKGVVGIVVVGLKGNRRIAVKIRRVDARRLNLIHEAEHLKTANSLGVGPECLGGTPDVLAMELIEGLSLPLWLETLKGRGRRSRVRSVLRPLLEECVRMDAYGLDHGELSRAHKNVIVSNNDSARILDFESASVTRRPSNFTSLTQYLFLGGSIAKKMIRILGPVDRDELLRSLRDYKAGGWKDAFESASRVLGLN
ncbi:MAG TPA: serine/threonine protein kinase [Candidatus Bathyarchaeia archaeon]|nr:serine/threonine protein kinase [Candidatus Bathyarchaeia archaeon]